MPLSPIRTRVEEQTPCLRYHKQISFALALLLLSSIVTIQLLDNPFATNITGVVQRHVTSMWQRSAMLLEQTPLSAPLEVTGDVDMDAALSERPELQGMCTEAYRTAEYEKVEKWGLPPLFKANCDYPHCEEWLVHEMLGHYRQRDELGPLKTTPCDVWKMLFGRTTWLMGDSQTQYWYRTLRCVLHEFLEEPGVKDQPFTEDPELTDTLKSRVFLEYEGGVGMPICTRFIGNTRVCLVRVNFGYHMVDQYLPQMHLFNASLNDFLFINTGLWHHKREGQYEDIVRNITQFVHDHRDQLPMVIWRDNSPQHFDIEYGEFPHPEEVGKKLTFPIACKKLENLTLDEYGALHGHSEHVQAGGWRNKLSQPLVDAAKLAHMHTWNETVLWWNMHTRQENGNIECTHFCGPGPYHVWVWLQTKLLEHLREQGVVPPAVFKPVPILLGNHM